MQLNFVKDSGTLNHMQPFQVVLRHVIIQLVAFGRRSHHWHLWLHGGKPPRGEVFNWKCWTKPTLQDCPSCMALPVMMCVRALL